MTFLLSFCAGSSLLNFSSVRFCGFLVCLRVFKRLQFYISYKTVKEPMSAFHLVLLSRLDIKVVFTPFVNMQSVFLREEGQFSSNQSINVELSLQMI